MTQFILDLFFAFIFVLLLIFMAKIREKAFKDNKESYRYAFSGMLILGVVSVIQLAGHQMLFWRIPFLSEPVYQELASAIGIVAGIALLLAGVSVWLPVKRNQDLTEGHQSKFSDGTEYIIRAIDEAQNADQLFRILPELLCRKLHWEEAAVIRRINREDRFSLFRWHGLADDRKELIKNITDRHQPIPDLMAQIKESLPNAFIVTPSIKEKVQALILVGAEKEPDRNRNVGEAMFRIENAISSRLTKFYEDVRRGYAENTLRLLTEARNLTVQRTDLKGILPELYRLFHRATGAEYFSLAVREKYRHNLRRYIAGINGNVLLGGVTSPVFKENYIDHLFESRQSLAVGDILNRADFRADSLFASCGQRSLLAIPVVGGGAAIGIITLGHPKPGRLGPRELVRAEFLATAIAPIVEAEISRYLAQERDRYLGTLAAFEATVERCGDIESLSEAACEILLKSVGTTFCRITSISDDRTRLVTESLKTIRPFAEINAEPVVISKELIPWHYLALAESRPLLINQNDASSAVESGEANMLLFKGVQSALIIPVIINGLTYGTITLGEMREWNRFAYDSAAISFCKALTTRLANGIKLVQLSRTLLKNETRIIPWENHPADENNIVKRLKEPMTTIQGSIDLLRIRGEHTNGDTERIMGMLEKSTERALSILKGN
ncbi:membrane hypothetical protein [Candidatus Zixiibacteriota bacterium]|nr:membrane hypothetical protein [candidate division Zixibacteria bacterium]